MEQPNNPIPPNDALSLLQSARSRRAIQGCEDIFGDPAFEILLALSIHQNDGALSVEEVAQAVDLPAENVNRWLTALERVGLLEIQAKTIRLTARAHGIVNTSILK